ncbi:uncharacterized protein METZ01_LOCUS410362, partial [marine metagenome]
MSEKDEEKTLEDIHKQLRDLLNNKNVQVAFAPFMESIKANSEDVSDADEAGGGSEEVCSSELTRDEKLDGIRRFDRRPKEIRDYLDRFVIKQEQAKRVLSVAVCDHYNHVRSCLKDEKLAKMEYVK